jgi:beta-glucanase (GH16 family)
VKVEFDKQNITNMSVFTHKYAVEWHPGQVIFYLDDVPVGSAYNDPRVPFNPSQVVIDMQVDGGACAPNSATLFPQKMKVNYFKYYRLKTQCNSNVLINNNNFDFNNPINFSVKKTYSITNTTIATGANVALRATDYINLGSGFEVPIGASFSALTTPCY